MKLFVCLFSLEFTLQNSSGHKFMHTKKFGFQSNKQGIKTIKFDFNSNFKKS